MTIDETVEWINRNLGWPVVKVELPRKTIEMNIITALNRYIKYASGIATTEGNIVIMLSGGQKVYELPDGVTDVISIGNGSPLGGINTLFTVNNQLYNAGLLDFQNMDNNWDLTTFHLALDFIEKIERYTSLPSYDFTFHGSSDILSDDKKYIELDREPDSGYFQTITIKDENGNPVQVNVDSPGFLQLHVNMLEGSTLPGWSKDKTIERLLDQWWCRLYSLALCKVALGMIRRKFENYASIGNTGIALDGSALISEGKDELNELEDKLKNEESYPNGSFIITGIC